MKLKREKKEKVSGLRFIPCAETGDVVDQYGRGFRQVGGKLVPSGRLYFRTETTARPR